ncbi:MAG: choice-of-anchor X domain-containing protein [Gemmataceae bacterium]
MRLIVLILMWTTAWPLLAAEPKPFPGPRGNWNGFGKHEFTFEGRRAIVVVPSRPAAGRPWVWRGEFFGAFAEADAAMVKDGWHLVYLEVPDLFGAPRAMAQWEKFYQTLVKEHGLHPKPGLIGLSRGGLYCMHWAATHPDKTLAVYLDNAVCDFKSWPGGKPMKLGTGNGSPGEWQKLLKAHGFRSDAEAIAYKGNPVDNLAPVARAKIPLLLVYGDSDRVVPHAENSEIIFKRYRELGGPVERIVKPGQDHHPHGLKDVTPVVKFFRAARAADAAVGKPKDVRHAPVQPTPGVPVRVTARLATESATPVLRLQPVAPGKYIRRTDREYETTWIDLPMRDDGREGDEKAGDGVYSVLVPASYQKHRWLLRYRVVARGPGGRMVQAPGSDDDCPNFAWWCSEGPAAWKAASEPGKSPPLTFSSEFLKTLQSLTLLARDEDVTRSQWDGNAHKQRQAGTIVYRGVVYDHIQFSNRGQGSAHIAGKNKWGLKFNRGHSLKFLDHAGVPFPAGLSSLNLNPGGSTPYLPVLRGIGGLDEVMSMRAYRLAGVPTAPATWVQWRVVTGADELSARDQYAGDLWGLYVAIADMDPDLLADTRLPDGLTVSIQSGLKHVPRSLPDAPALWEKFIHGLRSNPDEAWCRKHLDLPAYFSFHAMNRLLGNVDLRPDGNHGYYRSPAGKWAPIPWDNDMMFVPRHHQPGHIDAITCLRHPAILSEYRNRAREILDLFASDRTERGGQVGQLVTDLGAALTPRGYSVDWPRLDAARWNHHPRMNPRGIYFANPYEADYFGGRWKRTLATADFAGFRQLLIDFCTDCRPGGKYAPNDGDQRGYGWGYLNLEARDEKIPATTKVMQEKGAGYRFQAGAFDSPAGHRAGALEWRVGRVGQPGWYELAPHWNGETSTERSVDLPDSVFKEAGEYRVRARWRDHTGRCSHWSAPVTVVTR